MHEQDFKHLSRHGGVGRFIRQATLSRCERAARGAKTVVAVTIGAPRLQKVIDAQCANAVRILDFTHATSHLTTAAQAAFVAGSREAEVWMALWGTGT